MREVTVVILNWNGQQLLEQFLPSVLASTYTQAEIWVADNGSTDSSIAFVKASFPQVKVVELGKNYGFAEGNNRAVARVETPYVILLNSDVEVDPNWIGPLVSVLENNPEVAAVQPKIRSYHNKEYFEYAGAAGGMIDKLGYPFCRGRVFDHLEKDEGQYEEAADIFWASGACCAIRTSVIKELGLFDGSYFAHMEEIDFCWRVLNHGYRVVYEPNSLVYHVGGGTLDYGNPRKTFLNVRNSLATLMKNLPKGQVFPKIFARLLLDGVWGIQLLIKGQFAGFWAIIRAHFAFYGRLGAYRRFRREVYKTPPEHIPSSGLFKGSIVWDYFVKGRKVS
ncbi:MAG: glycosyltransferase family 2 protein [Bacteroidota bacterium]